MNEVKDYLWENKNTMGREHIMKMAILINRMEQNVKIIEMDCILKKEAYNEKLEKE